MIVSSFKLNASSKNSDATTTQINKAHSVESVMARLILRARLNNTSPSLRIRPSASNDISVSANFSSNLRDRSMMRVNRFVNTNRLVPTPVSKKTGAIDN